MNLNTRSLPIYHSGSTTAESVRDMIHWLVEPNGYLQKGPRDREYVIVIYTKREFEALSNG